MIEVSKTVEGGREIVAEIERRSGQDISSCYQCGTCSSTCAATFAFDYPPHLVMRLLQLGMVDQVLSSRTGQLCYDCMTCSSRCPVGIDVADVIETAKNIADESGIRGPLKDVGIFRRLFLKNVRKHGRLHEASLLGWFNIKSGRFLNDLSLVPLVLKKRKLHLVAPRIRNRKEIHRIFNQVKSKEDPK